jgi:hypothetical protein
MPAGKNCRTTVARSGAHRGDGLFAARIGAARATMVEDVYMQNRWLPVQLREKGGKRHAMARHHNLEEFLTAYLDGARLRSNPKTAAVPHRPVHPHACKGSFPVTEVLSSAPNGRSGVESGPSLARSRRAMFHRYRTFAQREPSVEVAPTARVADNLKLSFF